MPNIVGRTCTGLSLGSDGAFFGKLSGHAVNSYNNYAIAYAMCNVSNLTPIYKGYEDFKSWQSFEAYKNTTKQKLFEDVRVLSISVSRFIRIF